MDDRVNIERISADGTITKGTARQRGVTVDDFRSLYGSPLDLSPGEMFVIVIEYTEESTG